MKTTKKKGEKSLKCLVMQPRGHSLTFKVPRLVPKAARLPNCSLSRVIYDGNDEDDDYAWVVSETTWTPLLKPLIFFCRMCHNRPCFDVFSWV